MQVKSIAECSREHSAILLTFIKLPFVLKTFFAVVALDRFYCTQYVLIRTGGLIGLNMGSLSQICFYLTFSLIPLLLV